MTTTWCDGHVTAPKVHSIGNPYQSDPFRFGKSNNDANFFNSWKKRRLSAEAVTRIRKIRGTVSTVFSTTAGCSDDTCNNSQYQYPDREYGGQSDLIRECSAVDRNGDVEHSLLCADRVAVHFPAGDCAELHAVRGAYRSPVHRFAAGGAGHDLFLPEDL